MFDIGFSELLLVFVIGLVVLGPERLPVAVRSVAGWIRTLRAMAASVQNELNQELKLQELQDSLKKAEEAGLKNLSPEIKSSIDDLKEAASSMKRSIHENLSPSDQAIADAQDGNTIHNPVLRDPEAHYDEGISPATADHQAASPAMTPSVTSEPVASVPVASESVTPAPAVAASESTVDLVKPQAVDFEKRAVAAHPEPQTAPLVKPQNTASAPATKPVEHAVADVASRPAEQSVSSSQTTGER